MNTEEEFREHYVQFHMGESELKKELSQAFLNFIKSQGFIISRWRDINEAPKDETVVICFEEPFFGKVIHEVENGFFDTERDGWYFNLSLMGTDKKVKSKVVGWMHKPEPMPLPSSLKEVQGD